MTIDPAAAPSGQDRAKIAAARLAADTYVFDGAKLGLGSGSTSHHFVRALADRVRDGLEVVGVATSTATRDLAVELGVTMLDLDRVEQLDVCLDGADEVDPQGTMIKGGGACLLWEKLVAQTSARMVVITDQTKVVPTLGAFPLPIEIVQFAHGTTTRAVRALLVEHGYPQDLRIELRQAGDGPLVTDNGNFIIDARLEAVRDPARLTVELNQIPGVVENGLFLGIADEIVVGWPDETAATYRFPLTLPLTREG